MSRLKNLLNQFMPHFEARRTTGTVAAINAEVIHSVNGDESAVIFLNGTGTFNATYNIQGSPDGVNYYDLATYPYSPGCVGGTIPQAGQPLFSEAVNAATIQRTLCMASGGLQTIRIRLTAYTSGSGAITINSDSCASLSPFVRDIRAATLAVTTTAAVGVAATATLPAVAGLRHYIDNIQVNKFNAALLTAAATPVLVTTTNIPGGLVLSFDAQASAQGTNTIQEIDGGSTGLAAIAINTATTVVCPATPNVIWRVNVLYRLGT